MPVRKEVIPIEMVIMVSVDGKGTSLEKPMNTSEKGKINPIENRLAGEKSAVLNEWIENIRALDGGYVLSDFDAKNQSAMASIAARSVHAMAAPVSPCLSTSIHRTRA